MAKEHVMNEIGRFTKINGRWIYLDAVIEINRQKWDC